MFACRPGQWILQIRIESQLHISGQDEGPVVLQDFSGIQIFSFHGNVCEKLVVSHTFWSQRPMTAWGSEPDIDRVACE